MKIYLDVCCLNRPFDDQSQPRIRLETEAILLIIDKRLLGQWIFVSSDATEVELDNIPDSIKYQRVIGIAREVCSEYISYTPEIINRAKFLASLGFGRMDALHIACAEVAKVDIFLTTDSKLIKIAKRNSSIILIEIENPSIWLERQEEYEDT